LNRYVKQRVIETTTLGKGKAVMINTLLFYIPTTRYLHETI